MRGECSDSKSESLVILRAIRDACVSSMLSLVTKRTGWSTTMQGRFAKCQNNLRPERSSDRSAVVVERESRTCKITRDLAASHWKGNGGQICYLYSI